MRSFLSILFLSLTAASFADDRSADPDDPQYDYDGAPNYPYEGPTGKRYQYDLSNPGEAIRYSVDPGAQIRDSINPDPRIQLDRDLGAAGGGAEQ